MHLILFFFLFSFTSIYADSKSISLLKADSISNYLEASNLRKKENNFRKSFDFVQKAIMYAEKDNDIASEAKVYLHLGQLYTIVKALYEKKPDRKIDTLNFSKFYINNNIKSIQKLQKASDKQLLKQREEIKLYKLISIISLALLAILSLFSLSLYRKSSIRKQSYQLLKEKNTTLQLSQEKAERASAARSEFLCTVSHELRTPLNAITGITHLLIDEDPKPHQLEYLKSLQFSGKYLMNYINEILEINRIESKNIEVEKIDFDIKKLLVEIQNSLQELANENKNKLILTIDPNIPEDIIGDPTKLSQIFINLINNALKFTQKGEVKITATLLPTDNQKASIYFEIADTGIGIPEDQLESIFDSFSQGSIETNRQYGGTGLGLTIVKRLIIILGGNIKLKSQVRTGSVFSFTLDFKLGIKKLSSNTVFPHDENNFIAKKILLVEDNKINQMIIKRMLEKKQIVCEIIENGEDAVAITKINRYDLILMDVHLPGINGTIATQQIRQFDIVTPIVALTAISLLENREMLLSYGMNDVITKPFEPDNFFAIIAECMQKDNTNNSESVI